jgi:hypothetical protein
VKPSTYTETQQSELDEEFTQEWSERTYGQWNVSVDNMPLPETEVWAVVFVTSVLGKKVKVKVSRSRPEVA